MEATTEQSPLAFSADERAAVYKCIFNRRDMRGQFRPDPLPDAVLGRVLRAAHHAPSVGFMQPWDFVLVRDLEVKRRVHAAFEVAQSEATKVSLRVDDVAGRYWAQAQHHAASRNIAPKGLLGRELE